jgi:hypothetical protein
MKSIVFIETIKKADRQPDGGTDMRSTALAGLFAAQLALFIAAPAAAEPSVTDPDQIGKWVKARIKSAKDGKREIVRVPIASQSAGWGCICPQHYLGYDPNVGASEDGWIKPVAGPGVTLPGNTREGWVMVAEGYFTGASAKESGGPGQTYTVYELQVIRLRAFQGEPFDEENPDVKLRVILTGEEAAREVPPLDDGRPWIVLAGSYPIAAKDSGKKAEALKAKLAAEGFSGAEIFDSRSAARLYCCYQIVAAGRYATEEEAKAALKEVKKKFKGVYLKQGW